MRSLWLASVMIVWISSATPGQKWSCKDLQCRWPRKCVVLKKEGAVCACAENCQYKKVKEKIGIVCGTDDKEYRNACELEQQRCLTGGRLYLKNYGPCRLNDTSCIDTAEIHRCRWWKKYNVCKSFQSLMKSMCSKTCELCVPKNGECFDKLALTKCSLWAKFGACESHQPKMARQCARTCKLCGVSEKCRGVKCLWPQRCVVDRDGNPSCSCIRMCHHRKVKKLLGRVCASNQKEYRNRCDMEYEACKLKTTLVVANYGACNVVPDSCQDSFSREQCKYMSQFGACKEYSDTLQYACQRTCGFCGVADQSDCTASKFGCCWDGETPAGGIMGYGCPACEDKYKFCAGTFKSCNSVDERVHEFMRRYCQRTCGYC